MDYFSSNHVSTVLDNIGMEIAQETVHDVLCMCIYHGNRHTPSLSVSKKSGQFICFNPACGERGTINDLVKRQMQCNDLAAIRVIANLAPEEQDVTVENVLENPTDFVPFSQAIIDRMKQDLPGSAGYDYMIGRNFEPQTLIDFDVGFSKKKQLVSVPAYNHTGIPVGVIGRSIVGKRFENSKGLPGTKIFFNLNNAVRYSHAAVVVESAFDAMRVHQAGYPNVVATLGGYLSPHKKMLLNKYFTEIIVMTDNDEPGRQLGMSLSNSFDKSVLWASWDDTIVYPHGAKDAGDMTDEEIKQVVKNAVPDIEYRMFVV